MMVITAFLRRREDRPHDADQGHLLGTGPVVPEHYALLDRLQEPLPCVLTTSTYGWSTNIV